MPSDRGTALVTGGGRGIGAGIARELAQDGWSVVVAARSRDQIDEVADEIGGRAIELDVSDREAVDRAVAETGDVELLVANAGVSGPDGATWEIDPADWWHVQEINVLGVHLCCRTVIPGMLERGSGRIVITGSGAAYLPGSRSTAYPTSKAAVCRYGETLANELRGRIPVFFFSPGLVTPWPDRRPSASRPGSSRPRRPAAGSSGWVTPPGRPGRPPSTASSTCRPTARCGSGSGPPRRPLASSAALNNGAWHHVVGTYSTGGNGMKLYVDGALQDSTKATTVTMPTGYWRAGGEQMTGWAGNPDQYFDGTLDELAVYPTELSQARVTAHRTAGITP